MLCSCFAHVTLTVRSCYAHAKLTLRSHYAHTTLTLRSCYAHVTLMLRSCYAHITRTLVRTARCITSTFSKKSVTPPFMHSCRLCCVELYNFQNDPHFARVQNKFCGPLHPTHGRYSRLPAPQFFSSMYGCMYFTQHINSIILFLKLKLRRRRCGRNTAGIIHQLLVELQFLYFYSSYENN